MRLLLKTWCRKMHNKLWYYTKENIYWCPICKHEITPPQKATEARG